MKRQLPFIVMALLVILSTAPIPILAQEGEEWTCDRGPNDILNAAQAAFDTGDLDRAAELVAEAQTICLSSPLRSLEVVALAEAIEAATPDTRWDSRLAHRDLRYTETAGGYGRLDVFLPEEEADGPLPTVIILHGSPMNKEEMHSNAFAFAGEGYAAIPVEFRPPEADYQSSLQDAACAIAWVHANAEAYTLDRERIVLVGFSFGGLMVSTLGTVDDPAGLLVDCPSPAPEGDWMQGVVVWAGVFMVPGVDTDQQFVRLSRIIFDLEEAEIVEALDTLANTPSSTWRDHDEWPEATQEIAQTLPLYWIDGSEVPFLILHGSAEERHSAEAAQAVADALTEAEFTFVPGASHTMVQTDADTEAFTLEFLDALFGENGE